MSHQPANCEAVPAAAGGRSAVVNVITAPRRRKIAIVLMLMLCGYFLIDERVPSTGLANRIEPTRDPAVDQLLKNLQSFNAESTPSVSDGSQVATRTPLPFSPPDPAVLNSAHREHHSVESASDPDRVNPAGDVPVPRTIRQGRRTSAPRPTLRFTGEIEPLN